MTTNALILAILLLNNFIYLGQINNVTAPELKTYQPIQPNQSYQNTPIASSKPKKKSISQYQSTNQPETIYNNLNQKNYTLGNYTNVPPKQISSVNYVKSLIKEDRKVKHKLSYTLPKLHNPKGIDYFEKAYKELLDMLEGRTPLSLKKAVFLVENAWFLGEGNYNTYNDILKESKRLIQSKMKQKGLSLDDNHAINYITHQYISDTLKISKGGEFGTITTLPKTYDFEDPFGYDDVTKMFVSKLIFANTGQCKSLPLYYLILVEELGGEAYLSFSPSHSFIQAKGDHNELYNIELTNGQLTTDSWILGSGYVKAESVRSGIYLDTINKKQVIANCLTDLARYYKWKYGKLDTQQGYDDFNLKCIDQTLKYHPTNIHAILEKSNYYTALLNYTAKQLNYTTEQQITSNPNTLIIFNQRNKLYALTDGLGFEPMPEHAYTDWLKTLEEKQQQQAHSKEYIKFSKIITKP